MSRRRAQRGFTLLEVTIAAAFAALTFAVFGQVFSTTDGLSRESRGNLRAHEELRRNLEAVANVLRGVDIDTLGGFDESGIASEPEFQRVTGADALGATLGGAEALRWEARPGAADGVKSPGRVVHDRGGVATVLADRVPEGGLQVQLDGTRLVVRLTTYYETAQRTTVTVSGETAVSLRN
jgi:hypothetical protein